nr:hypothetical protein [bacterium]
MRITDAGYVGIGTTSPYAMLSVVGSVVASHFIGTTTATSTFGGGIDIATGCFAIGGVCLADTTGITSLNGLTNGTQTFATTTDTNVTLSIVSSGSTHTFTPGWTGSLAAGRGGTGITNPVAAGILIGDYAGSSWQQLATSSLGLLTTNVNEGSNLYYTDARVNTYINASTTIPKTYSANIFTNANTFNGGLTIGSLNGPLQANNGVVSATSSIGVLYGGTGLSSAPTYGQLLVGNALGGYTLTATSSLGLGSGTVGSGTAGYFPYYAANGTTLTATSTLFLTSTGEIGVNTTSLITGSDFQINGKVGASPVLSLINNGSTQVGEELGRLAFGTTDGTTNDAASIRAYGDQNFTLSAQGTNLRFYTTPLNSDASLERMRINYDGNVGIGTTSPYAKLSVVGEVVASHFTGTTTATSTLTGGLQTALLNVTGSATSTFARGINLAAGCYAINNTCLTDTGITTLNGLTNVTQTFATSTDTNITLSIVSSGSTHTFTPGWTGSLAANRGGTGITNPSAAGILLGSYAGGGWQQVATSSLGLLTTNVNEGSNLYYTDARVNSYIHSSSTIPKTYTANTFTTTNTFTGSTILNGGLTVGTLNGPLQANNGLVSATTSIGVLYGGTGLSSVPSYGQLLVGNAAGGYTLTATSSLGLRESQWTTDAGNIYFNTGNVGIGTTSPYAKLSVSGLIVGEYFSATSTTATSTFAGGLDVGGGALTYDHSSGQTSISNLALGAMSFDADAGSISWVDMPVTSASAIGTIQSYSAQIDGNPLLTVYSESDGAGGVQNTRVGIGTTSPYAKLSVVGEVVASHFTGTTTATSTFGGALTVSGQATSTFALGLQAAALNVTGSATSTFANGLNLASGCYAISGVCLSSSNYGDTNVNSYIHSSSTIPKTYTANTFTTTNTFTGSTILNGGLTIGTLNGPLQANNGVVSATTSIGVLYGGTGLSSAPTYGQLLVGNVLGGYTLTATSSLGLGSGTVNSGTIGQFPYYAADGTTLTATSSLYIDVSGKIGIGTTTPASLLQLGYITPGVQTKASDQALTIGSSAGSIIFAGVNTAASSISGGAFALLYHDDRAAMSAGHRLGGILLGGSTNSTTVENSAGIVAYAESNWSGTSAPSYLTFETTSSGSVDRAERLRVTSTGNVGIGTTSPYAKLSVAGQIVGASFVGTTTATSTFGGGIDIATGCYAVAGVCLSSGSSGISSLNGLTDAAQTFATSTDTNITLSIVSSGSTHTFTPGWTGSLAAARGGTGITNPTAAGILLGSYAGGEWQQVATSSLGLITTNVNEGSNLYYTDARVNSYIHASTTIPKVYTANTFTTTNTFTGSTILNGGLTIGTLNGPLHANNGVVSATSSIGVLYGGTGLTAAPSYGQLLVGNALGGYTLTATSSLGLRESQWTTLGNNIYYTTGNVGIGTSSPYAALSVVGEAVARNFTATSTTATSTFAGGFNVGSGALNYDFSSGVTTIQNLELGSASFDTDAGMVTWVDMPVTSAATIGTVQSYEAKLDGNSMLTIYGESDGAGGVQNTRVGIGTTSPYAKLSVVGEVVASHFTGTTTATSTFGGALTVGGQATSTFALGLQAAALNVTGSATSTFANGLNLA